LLGSPDRDTRYGACEALACLGPKADPAARQLRALLADPDPWLRILAAEAVVRLGPQERTASVPDLLRAAGVNDPADRRKRVEGALAEALFTPGPGKRGPKAILTGSLDGVDRPLLYAAVRDMLKNEDGRIRGLVAPVYKLLTPQDVAVLLPDIAAAIRTPAPSGEMFAYGIRFAGVDLLARLRIREGMALSLELMNEFRWGRDMGRCIGPLTQYGGAAKDLVPGIREVRQKLAAQDKDWEKKDDDRKRDILALDKLITVIEADRKPPTLRSAEEFIRTPDPGK
jgi:hypothetical protein